MICFVFLKINTQHLYNQNTIRDNNLNDIAVKTRRTKKEIKGEKQKPIHYINNSLDSRALANIAFSLRKII